MRLVCMSDTHGRHERLSVPEGDVLIHAGDLTGRGKAHEVEAAVEWLLDHPHPHKVLIAGNHDWLFQREPALARTLVQSLHYLEDSGCEIEGVKFWGSPWQPWFYNWAFNLRTPEELQAKWDLIPADTQVLVTHSPPFGILDQVDEHLVGCERLLETVLRIRPRVHVFGHIHECHGRFHKDGVLFVNASICDVAYRARQPIEIIDL